MTARDVNAAQRASSAIALRASGVSYDEIAATCGYASAGAAYNAVQRELSRTVVSNVEHLRKEECDRLERLWAEVWKLAMDEQYKGRLFAVDRLLAIAERKARLMGLDVPTNTNINAQQVVIREVPHNYLGQPIPQLPDRQHDYVAPTDTDDYSEDATHA